MKSNNTRLIFIQGLDWINKIQYNGSFNSYVKVLCPLLNKSYGEIYPFVVYEEKNSTKLTFPPPLSTTLIGISYG